MILKSELLATIPGVEHGFGTRVSPTPTLLTQFEYPKWKQVHGVDVVRVEQPGQDCGEADGFWAGLGIPIGVRTADCVPILLARKDGSAVAALHAGWRGTVGRIVHSFGQCVKNSGDQLQNWVAAMGPSIRQCCYEVSSEIALELHKIEPSAVKGRQVDLARSNESLLRQIGVPEVEIHPLCTHCATEEENAENPVFFSYRRGHKTGRQTSAIVIL